MGGGIFVDGAKVNIKNSSIKENKAFAGGAIYITENNGLASEVTLTSDEILNNEADMGGAIFVKNGGVVVTGAKIA